MPLKPGKKNIGPNILLLKKEGYTNSKQRIAIALQEAGEAKKKPKRKK